jgi:hypothetical protein
MGQDVRRRFQKTISFQSNAQSVEDLGRGMVYRDLILRLRAQPTLTAANNLGDGVARGDGWGVVKLIEILVNNNQVIRSLTGNQLWWLNYFMYGAAPPITPELGNDDGAGGGSANPCIDVALVLPFWMFRCVRPMDTALDSRILSDLKIRVTWGTYTDIHDDASAWTAEPTLDVHSLESANIKGPFSLQTVYSISRTITADDTRFQIFLPVNDVYRGFLINTTDTGVDEGDILNNLKIKSGTTVFYDAPDELIKMYDGWLHPGIIHPIGNMSNALGTGPVARTREFVAAGDYDNDVYNRLQRSASSNAAGWYFVDLVTDGYLTDAIDTLGFSEFYLECDVSVGTGATKIDVLPIQITPVRGKA